MSRRVEFFYDYVSPFSYLASTQLPALAERTGAELVYRPFLLGGVMQAAGNRPPLEVPNKGKHMPIDLARWAEHYGVPLAMNPHFPMSTVRAMRAALVAQEETDAAGFRGFQDAMFRAMWAEGVNLADEAALGEVIAKSGLDAERVLARTQEQPVKDRLRANTDEAVERGAFGAPTFFVGDELFFGNDRLPFVEKALRGRS